MHDHPKLVIKKGSAEIATAVTVEKGNHIIKKKIKRQGNYK